jgi:hypothetical protein
METFLEMKHTEIMHDLGEVSKDILDSSVMPGPPPTRHYRRLEQRVIQRFQNFIREREMDGVIPGVPTMASWRGVNHNLSHPYARRNPIRPSFIDTGLYLGSFKAWVSDD